MPSERSEAQRAAMRRYNERMSRRQPRRKRRWPRQGITVDLGASVRLGPQEFAECFRGIVALQARPKKPSAREQQDTLAAFVPPELLDAQALVASQ